MTRLSIRRIHLYSLLPAALTTATLLSATVESGYAQTPGKRPLPTKPAAQSVITIPDQIARGNVKFGYSPEQILATADQAEYFYKQGRVVLSGNVQIFQNGETHQVETVTYLVKKPVTITADTITENRK